MSQSTEAASRGASSAVDHDGPEAALLELDRDQCLRLLSATNVGRIAVVLAGSREAIIRPVNYVFDTASQSIVIRSRTGSKLHALLHATRAAFEIDGTEETGGLSWSVIVHGPIEKITAPSELRRVERLGLESKVPAAPDSSWLRIRLGTVSGRGITST